MDWTGDSYKSINGYLFGGRNPSKDVIHQVECIDEAISDHITRERFTVDRQMRLSTFHVNDMESLFDLNTGRTFEHIGYMATSIKNPGTAGKRRRGCGADHSASGRIRNSSAERKGSSFRRAWSIRRQTDRLSETAMIEPMDRSDRFTFMPGDLKEVTDERHLAEIKRKYGDISMPQDEYEWVRNEGKTRWSVGDYVSTDELRSEYARRKALGNL